MELGYWKIKGAGHPLRMLLAHEKVEFKNTLYDTPESWFGKKETMGFDFPNLPYLIDGDVKITETSAIPQYIAFKLNKPELTGKPGFDKIKYLEIVGVIKDILDNLGKIFYAAEGHEKIYDDQKDRFFYGKSEKLEKFLGDKEFLLGYFTYADILLANTFATLDTVSIKLAKPSTFEKYPKLKAHAERVFNIPTIKAFLASEEGQLPALPPHYNKLGL